MTAQEMLSVDRLADAIVTQRAYVAANPIDHAAKLFYFELLVIAGKFLDAHAVWMHFESAVPEFQAYARSLRKLLRAERRRQHGFKPTTLLEPPMHMRCRWHAVKATQIANEAKAMKWADRADSNTPAIRGHVNGREFEGMRDADDRFASQFEFLFNGRYCWIPFEQVKKLTLGPIEGTLDKVLRPAEIILRFPARDPSSLIPLEATNHVLHGHLPLVYPGTANSGRDESFTLGNDADFDMLAGLVVGFGERVMNIGEEELPLSEIQQLEIRLS